MASAGWCAALEGSEARGVPRGTSWQGPQASPLCFGAILTVSALPLAPAFPIFLQGDVPPHAAREAGALGTTRANIIDRQEQQA